jgi:S1-C subfamily serine protease
LLYEDQDRDLAFLAVQTDLRPLRVAKSYAFRKGEDITVIGSPGVGNGQVLENAISRGVMSTKTQIDGHEFYQLGIAINPGNSGGPVFDSSGRVIGVATLKSSKQEAMGFCIPVEDLQAALAKLSRQTTADAERTRSLHRVLNAARGLGSGGALYCLVIDVRRAAILSNDSDVKELSGKLEQALGELDEDVFPSLGPQASRIKNDRLVAASVRAKIGELSDNFSRLKTAYSRGQSVNDNELRPLKQNHRRLIIELSRALKLEVPEKMMVAFDDHALSQPQVVMGLGPPMMMGSLGQRVPRGPLGPRAFGPPMIPRPPNFPGRIGPRFGR